MSFWGHGNGIYRQGFLIKEVFRIGNRGYFSQLRCCSSNAYPRNCAYFRISQDKKEQALHLFHQWKFCPSALNSICLHIQHLRRITGPVLHTILVLRKLESRG
ncbi:102aa long hypothetical protein [Pyrococcus horikoshii OT3]|uniref:Uncharacterized protein n=1 Tax=Pyrococcus horikoshii (strain ATCC 700860 / DSM 12428 / JCM 9974 / NBRC 100139 / OT-3) TaxID=70601 RepID=O57745_PYRHO|nr:102aa long hypothetical protein [Pyrococcus horikoshii OT3]